MRQRVTILILLLCLLANSASGRAEASLRAAATKALRGRTGTALVMEVTTGRLLSAYSLERAARRRVRPGSAVKPFVLATLVDAGLLKHEAGIPCARDLRVTGRNLSCAHPRQPMMRAEEALAYSCNTYFAQMAARLTATQLQQGLRRWGLAARTGLRKDEASGKVGLSRTPEQLQLQGVGEENILITPLGLLNAYRRLAVERRANSESCRAHAVVYSGMEAATQYGMARLAQPAGTLYGGKPLRVAGKTGTSKAAEGPWTHGWFAGFAPADRPEIVVVVFVENGTGPVDAAPVARQLFEAWTAEKKQ